MFDDYVKRQAALRQCCAAIGRVNPSSEVKDIAEHPVVLRMKLYPHHGSTNCYQHCMNVAYYNYQWCRFLHLGCKIGSQGRDDP